MEVGFDIYAVRSRYASNTKEKQRNMSNRGPTHQDDALSSQVKHLDIDQMVRAYLKEIVRLHGVLVQ